MCLRYILTFVFDGLAFGMWVRSGSYMRKPLRLHYMGNRKYEIKVPNFAYASILPNTIYVENRQS